MTLRFCNGEAATCKLLEPSSS